MPLYRSFLPFNISNPPLCKDGFHTLKCVIECVKGGTESRPSVSNIKLFESGKSIIAYLLFTEQSAELVFQYYLNTAFQVLVPQILSTLSPIAFWNAPIAFAVRFPASPSTLPV